MATSKLAEILQGTGLFTAEQLDGVLARLKQANPQVRVVLTGCSVRADNAPALHRRYPAVDLFLRPGTRAICAAAFAK